MINHMDATQVQRFLTHVISPVYRVAEDDTIRDPHMDELKTLAIELQDLLQNKVGTTKFSNVYNAIRQNVLTVRRDRKTARAVQVCSLVLDVEKSGSDVFYLYRLWLTLKHRRRGGCKRMCRRKIAGREKAKCSSKFPHVS